MIFRRQTRGATLLLVLAMLAILFLIGAAMSFTTRMEGQASSNFAELTQARESTITGLPLIVPLIRNASLGVTSTLQPWAVLPDAWAGAAKSLGKNNTSPDTMASLRGELARNGLDVENNSDGSMTNAPQTIFRISDLSGRVNLNAVRSEKGLSKVLEKILPNSKDVDRKTKALYAMKGGEDVSTGPQRLDLRQREPDGKRRIENLAWLRYKGSKSGQPLFQEDELRVVNSFLTVFSQAPELLNFEDAPSIPKISIRNLSAEVIFEALQLAFPEKDERLLMQFAANVEDFADTDHIPTIVVPNGLQPNPKNAIFGFEQTPLITEIYSDAVSPVTSGDDGQFIELFNPWDKPINVDGWRVKVSGAGDIGLNGVIKSNGYLIITDNYDQPDQNAPPESGSFLSIFGTTKDGSTKRIQVSSQLNLPDKDNFVTLEDAQGHLIDAFGYGNTGTLDAKVSFQREDPRLRACKASSATPFEHSLGEFSEARSAWLKGDKAFGYVTDVLRVATAYAGSNSTGSTFAGPVTTKDAHPSQKPLLTRSVEGQSLRTNLDLRVIDLFTEQNPVPVAKTDDDTVADTAAERADLRKQRLTSGYASQVAQVSGKTNTTLSKTEEPTTSASIIHSYGKLNLNTCSKMALSALEISEGGPDLTNDATVEKFEAYRLERIAQKKPPFVNVSDFVAQAFPSLQENNLDGVGQILEQVTVGSSAFEIIAENRREAEDPEAEKDGKNPNLVTRKPARSAARWIVSTDIEPYSLLNFVITP